MAGGRPRIDIDFEQFKGLCAIMCTEEEIAHWFRCSVDTIERWCKRELKLSFADAYKKYSVGGKISIRRYQMKMAEHNATMAIWLGKQYLGQTDKQEVAVAVNDDESVREMEQYFENKKNDRKKRNPKSAVE